MVWIVLPLTLLAAAGTVFGPSGPVRLGNCLALYFLSGLLIGSLF